VNLQTLAGVTGAAIAGVLIVAAYVFFDDWGGIAIAIALVWGMLFIVGHQTANS
jgi:hypothetical protein